MNLLISCFLLAFIGWAAVITMIDVAATKAKRKRGIENDCGQDS